VTGSPINKEACDMRVMLLNLSIPAASYCLLFMASGKRATRVELVSKIDAHFVFLAHSLRSEILL
jgi:hypothetical protein